MEQVLLKASAFIFIIIFGYIMKKKHLFQKEDYKIVSKIVINITLPAAIISSFGKFEKDNSLFILVILGVICNLIMIFLGYFYSKNKSDKTKVLYMLNLSGYNIGSFTLPFVQNFLGAFGVIATCMFDIGNSILCTGGSYAITSATVRNEGEKISIKSSLQKLFSSVPFLTYITMLIFAVINIKIPRIILSITEVAGAANGFASMLMIGLMFEIKFKYDYISKAGIMLVMRYLTSGILAFIFYFLTPFSLEIRQVLTIVIFAPISVLSPLFTEKCKGDTEVASFINSMSIIISVTIITILLIVLGIK